MEPRKQNGDPKNNNSFLSLQFMAQMTLRLSETFKDINEMCHRYMDYQNQSGHHFKSSMNGSSRHSRKEEHNMHRHGQRLSNRCATDQLSERQASKRHSSLNSADDINSNILSEDDEGNHNSKKKSLGAKKSYKNREEEAEEEIEGEDSNEFQEEIIPHHEKAKKTNTSQKQKNSGNKSQQKSPLQKQADSKKNTQEKESSKKVIKVVSHKPKAPTSSFLLFFKEQQHSIAKSYPNYGVVELTRVAAKCWNQLSAEEKQPYVKTFEVERKKYQEQMEKYKKQFPEQIAEKEKLKKEKKKQKAKESKQQQKQEKSGASKQGSSKPFPNPREIPIENHQPVSEYGANFLPSSIVTPGAVKIEPLLNGAQPSIESDSKRGEQSLEKGREIGENKVKTEDLNRVQKDSLLGNDEEMMDVSQMAQGMMDYEENSMGEDI